MISDFGLFVAAVYFSSLMFVLIPALGLSVGAIAGKLTPDVSIALGSIVGLVSGVFGILLATLTAYLAFWVFLELGYGPPPRYLTLLIVVGLPLGGVITPVAVLQLFRRWRIRW